MNTTQNKDKSKLWIANPIFQATLLLVFCLISQIVLLSNGYEQALFWQFGLLTLMIFILFNILMGFQVKNYSWYWRRSVGSYVGLLVISIFIIGQFTDQSLSDAGLTRRMYNLFTVVYGILTSMMGAARWIVKYAEEEKWTKPRQKSRR